MAADVNTLPVKGNGAMAVIPSEDSLTAPDVARLLLEAGANPNLQLKRRPPLVILHVCEDIEEAYLFRSTLEGSGVEAA